MKRPRFLRICSALLTTLLFAGTFVPRVYADDTALVDSGINYSDAVESVTVNGKTQDALYTNPYRGFHNWPLNLTLKNTDNNKPVDPATTSASKDRILSYFPVDLSDFSGAYHPEDGERGPDAKLTASALDALDKSLENFRRNNNQVILRFVYDKNNDGIYPDEGCVIPDDEVVVDKSWVNYNRIVEPRQAMIMRHIEQLAPILVENADVICTVQIGLYGAYGELHSTGACSDVYIAQALDKMLQETRGSNLRISARTPRRYAYYRFGSTNIDPLANDVTTADEDAYRVAIFNDGYLGTDNDWGTFLNREKETEWMATQNLHNPYGGDAIPDTDGSVHNMAKQPAVIKEMTKVHTSYISADYRLKDYWRATPYDGSLYDVTDTEYAGKTLYQYIENHLGYRFVIRDSKLSASVKAGGTLHSAFAIENVGFGNLFYPVESCAYITDENGCVVAGPVDVAADPTNYQTKTTCSESMDIAIPSDLAPGKYNLYLQFKVGDREVGGATKPYGAIRFANNDVWNAVLEANYLGSFTVDRDVTVTKQWDDGEDASSRPDSLTFTAEPAPRVPDEYQETEYIESDGAQYIDTGVTAQADHSIYFDGYIKESAGELLCAYVDNNNRLGMKILSVSNKIGRYWRLGGGAAAYSEVPDMNGIRLAERFQAIQSSAGVLIRQGDKTVSDAYAGITAGTGAGNWLIMHPDNTKGVLYEARITKNGEVLHHYVPCYRKADGEVGLYDRIDGVFLTNAGSGAFTKGDDVTTTPETITVAKDAWTVEGNTWTTTLSMNDYSGDILLYEDEVTHYESDATAESKKTIDNGNAVTITNTLGAHVWGKVAYAWAKEGDDWKCTATRVCEIDEDHVETETVTASYAETKAPTVDADGEGTYTAVFTNTAFAKQTRTEPIPKLPAPDDHSYSTIKGDGGSWTKGTANALSFTFKRSVDDPSAFDHFTGIKVDGKAVPEKDSSGKTNYTAKSGSVIIDLQPSFLEKLATGKHTLVAVFDDGSASADFTIRQKSQAKTATDSGASKTDAPKTGDANMPVLWIAILLLSALVLIRTAICRRRPTGRSR